MPPFTKFDSHPPAVFLRVFFSEVLRHEISRIELTVDLPERHLFLRADLLNPQVASVNMPELSETVPGDNTESR